MMKEQKGITLIALVITIIVLLILAGVSIALLSGDNGLLTKSTEAENRNAIGAVKDEVNLAYQVAFTEYLTNKHSGKTGEDNELKSLFNAEVYKITGEKLHGCDPILTENTDAEQDTKMTVTVSKGGYKEKATLTHTEGSEGLKWEVVK